MLKRFFHFSLDPEPESNHARPTSNQALSLAEADPAVEESESRGITTVAVSLPTLPIAPAPSFENIYRTASVKPTETGYTILKLVEMVNSPHLAGMSQDGKRSSLLMALDAAGAHVEDLLQDALIRQRALNEYEDAQEKKLAALDAQMKQDNSLIQAELERVTAGYMERIQANLDRVARFEDSLRAWKRRKQQESQQIAEAASFCAPQGSSGSTNLSAVMAASPRR